MLSSALSRFLRYVTIDTQADERSARYPSTPGQLDLLRLLVEELRAIGLADAAMDGHGYVTATVPPATSKRGVPVIGLVAHVDTSPEVSGAGVRPILHRAWDGRDIVLPDAPDTVLRAAEHPELRERIGHDIVTASGLTLLGADDKAGVAEIMAAAEHLMTHPGIPHGRVRILFTPDEEIGRGVAHLDVAAFGAAYAYTVDGGDLGEIEVESFSADTMTVVFRGFNVHPGYAKGKMVNALKAAADFVGRLPRDGASPETTDGYEGYVHPFATEGGVERAALRLLARDFSREGLAVRHALIERLARQAVAAWPGAEVEITVEEQYRNMREVLDRHPAAAEHAREAIRRAGLEPKSPPIRGGTDGTKLCFMGLPTPNLFAGQHSVHSRLEWVSAQDMDKAVEVLVRLCEIWEERTPA